jgi:hypothetical protein
LALAACGAAARTTKSVAPGTGSVARDATVGRTIGDDEAPALAGNVQIEWSSPT